MNIQPIEGEQGRFFVTSASRPDQQHTVDLQYVEEDHKKPHAACGCESNFIYGRICPHILATVAYEQARLNL